MKCHTRASTTENGFALREALRSRFDRCHPQGHAHAGETVPASSFTLRPWPRQRCDPPKTGLPNERLVGKSGRVEALALAPPTVDEDDRLAAVDLSTTRVHVREIGNRASDVIIVFARRPWR
jgi:hypothetical protein